MQKGEKVIFLFIAVEVTPKKRFEFEQTMESLMDDLRAEKGCLDYHVCRDFKDPNKFFITNRWKQKNDLMNHIQTDFFGILMGAITNLCEENPIDINLSASAQNLLEIELTLKKQLSNTIHIESEADIQ